MWRLMEGEPVTTAALAAVAGESESTVLRRIAAVKAAHPDIRQQLTEDERKYIARHYGDRSNPAICDWLEKQGIDPITHRRLDRR